jgi:hypothetical protein
MEVLSNFSEAQDPSEYEALLPKIKYFTTNHTVSASPFFLLEKLITSQLFMLIEKVNAPGKAKVYL